MFLIILKEEILLDLRNYGKTLQNFLFFCISFAVFFLASSAFSNEISVRTALIYNLWFCLLFNILFINSDFLKEDFDDGSLEQMVIKFPNFELFILAKIFANWLIFCLPILLTLPLCGLLLGLEKEFIWRFFALMIFASLAINFIVAFIGSLNLFGGKTSLIAIVVLPLILPILLIAFRGVVDFADLENFYLGFKLLFGLAILSVIFSCFFAAKIVKISYE